MKVMSDGSHRGWRRVSIAGTAILLLALGIFLALRRPGVSDRPAREAQPSPYARTPDDAQTRRAGAEVLRRAPLEARAQAPEFDAPAAPERKAAAQKNYDAIPAPIAPGSAKGPDKFVLRDRAVSAFFTDRGVNYSMIASDAESKASRHGHAVLWGLDGAAASEPRGAGPLETRITRMVGDSSTWQVDLPTYSRVEYDNVRPGVGMVVESRPHGLKYTLHVAPRADASGLVFRYAGAEGVDVRSDGSSVAIMTSAGVLVEDDLRVWQEGPQGRKPVTARFVQAGRDGLGIELGEYDPDLALVIDPAVSWGSFLGGRFYNGGGDDYGTCLAMDTSSGIVLGGYTYSADFPTTAGAFQTGCSTLIDSFVAKFQNTGTTLLAATYIGGGDSDYLQSLRLDGSNNVYVTGYTYSRDFPVTAGAYKTNFNNTGAADAFVCKLNATTLAVVYSTLLGGSDTDVANAIAVDAAGNAYVTGYTYSTDFAAPGGGYDTTSNGSTDVFVAKLNTTGSALVWWTYIGGSDSDQAQGIVVDSSSNVYITGYTYDGTVDYPTTAGAYRTFHSGFYDTFVTKINSSGSGLIWSTLIGGTNHDYGYGIAIDTASPPNVYITGRTFDSTTDYPTTGGVIKPVHSGGYDAFVTKFNGFGSGLVWSTFMGGPGTEYGYGIVWSAGTGNIYISGYTSSTSGIPMVGGFQTVHGGGSYDAYLVGLNSAATAVVYGTYVGGSGTEYCYDLAENNGYCFITGQTNSTNFPVADIFGAPYRTFLGGGSDAYLTRINTNTTGVASEQYSFYLGGFTGQGYGSGKAVAVDSAGNAYIAGTTNTFSFPVTGGAFDPTYNGTSTYTDVTVSKISASGSNLIWSTYLGGAVSSEYPYALALGASNEVFVAGYTNSTDYPVTAGAYKTVLGGGTDSFVTKLNNAGSGLVYSTFLGGAASSEYIYAMAVDPAGSAYVTGVTYSSNYPVTGGAYDTTFGGGADGFVTKLNTAGTGLTWSTFLGGTVSGDYPNAIAVDSVGNVYVAGYTNSTDFPVTAGAYRTAFNTTNGEDMFVTKMNSTGSALVWSTFLGGSGYENAMAIAVDSTFNCYVAGQTTSSDFPVVGAFQPLFGGSTDAFITKFGVNGNVLVWSSFFGGSSDEYLNGMVIDGAGNAYITGYTYSTDLPLVSPLYQSNAGGADVFAARVNSTGSTLSWSTYIGGYNYDYGNGIAVSSAGHVYIAGETNSLNFPATVGAFDTTMNGTQDAFLFRIDNLPPSQPASLAQYRSDGITVIATGGSTNQTTLVLKGIATDSEGDRYKLQIEIQPIATSLTSPATVVPNGSTLFESGFANSATTATVTVGSRIAGTQYHWQARSIDQAGVASAWALFGSNLENPPNNPAANDVHVDQNPPSISIINPTGTGTYSTNLSTVAVSGIASDDVALFNVTWTNAANSTGGTASGTTSWSIASITLATGSNTITVTAQDTAGNTANKLLNVIYDPTPPTATITGPTSSPTFITSATTLTTLAGTYSDNIAVTSITYSNAANGANGTAGFSGGTWSVASVPLASGINNITVTAFDAAGNTGSDLIAVTSDASPPVVTITIPTSATTYNTAVGSISLGGTASDSLTSVTLVQWNNTNTGFSGTAGGTNNWTTPSIVLNSGANPIIITATDAAGNSSTDTITVVFDNTVPLVTIDTPVATPTYITNVSSIPLGGTASDTGGSGLSTVTWSNSATGGSGTASGTATWSVGTVTLAAGANAITVTATDGAGNTGTDLITVTYDPTAPTVIVTSPATNPFYTNGTSIIVSGTSSDNIAITKDEWQVNGGGFTVIAGATTSWSTPSIGLSVGSNTIDLRATDSANNTFVRSITVVRDIAPPAVLISSPASNPFYTTNSSLPLNGTASDVSGISQVEWRNTTTSPTFFGASGTTNWSVAGITLIPGSNSIEIRATDGAGNQATATLNAVLDNTQPTVAITTNGGLNFATNATPLFLAGTASDNALLSTVQWQNNGGGFSSAAGTASWTASIPLSAGSNAIVIRATDAAGNFNTATITVTLDQTAPSVVITGPTSASTFVTQASTFTLSGTVSDAGGGTVSVVNWSSTGPAPTSGTTTFGGGTFTSTTTINLGPGTQTITVTATDSAGNSSFDTLQITRDNTAPTLAVTTPSVSPFYTQGLSTSVAGTASDNVAVASVAWSRAEGGGASGTASGTTTWSAIVPLVAGTNTFTFTATDTAGNVNVFVVQTVIVRDNINPSIAITTGGGTSFTSNSTPVALAGTASDNASLSQVHWQNNGGPLNLATGTTTWTASIPLASGNNNIIVRATDSAGNTALASITVNYDANAPTVTITVPTSSPTFVTGNATLATLSGTASDDSGISLVEWRNNNGAYAPAGGTTAWSVSSIPLVGGTNTIDVRATDLGGSTSIDTIVVTLDQSAPVVAITAPTVNPTFYTTAASGPVSGTVSDAGGGSVASVTWVNSGGGSGTASLGAGTWSIASVNLAAGNNTVTVTATDSVGNFSSTAILIVRDNTIPTVAVSTPTTPHIRNTNPVPVTGTAADAGGSGVAGVSWSRAEGGGATGSAVGTTSWTANVSLVVGINTITFTSTDAAGNTSLGVVLVVTLDQTAPALAITSPTSASTYNTNSTPIALGGTVSDTGGGSVASVTWTNSTGGSGSASVGGSAWTIASVGLTVGSNVITVTATDTAGNSTNKVLTVFRDGAPPSVTITSPTTPHLRNTTPVPVTGTASDLETGIASVQWTNTTTTATGTATGTTAWSASIPLAVGANSISVTSTDLAGNVSAPALLSVTLDQAGPNIVVTTPVTATSYSVPTTASVSGNVNDVGGGTVASVNWVNSLGGSGAATLGAGTFSIPTITLTAGANVITLTAADNLGNTSTAIITIVQDAAAPTIAITSPTNQPTYTSGTTPLTLGGNASDVGAAGLLNITWSNPDAPASGTATGTTTWSASIPLNGSGVNNITVTAHDNAGNTSSALIQVTLNTSAPTITILNPTVNSTYFTAALSIDISGTANDDINVTAVEWSNNGGASWNAAATIPGTLPAKPVAWSAAGIPLVAGSNTINVRAFDGLLYGTDTLTVICDATNPAVTITTPAGSPYSTKVSPITLSGTASDVGGSGLASVTWFNAATSGTGTATGTTSWSASIGLTPGSNVITVRATDGAGNFTQSSTTVSYDPLAPTLAIAVPTSSPTYATSAISITLSGTASDNIGVTAVTAVNAANGSVGTPSGTTAWSIAGINLLAGSNAITVTATDAAGNTATAVITVTRDNNNPSVTITTNGGNNFITNSSSIVLGGTATDNISVSTVTWTNVANGGSGSATGTSTWTVPAITLAAGANLITVTATDGQGNPGTDTITVTYDSTAPTLSITTPTSLPTFTTSGATIDLGGTSSDNVAVATVTAVNSANGSAGTPSGTAPWSITGIALSPGSNLITVTATDTAGNTSAKVIAVTQDTTAPVVTITGPTASPTYLTSTSPLVVSGTSSDNVSVASVAWVNSAGGSGTATGTTNWSASIGLVAGLNTITVTVTDSAGNTSTDVIAVTFDSAAPTIVITTNGGAAFATNTSPVTLNGTASDAVGLASAKWTNAATGGAGTATGTGTWSATIPLAIGPNAITVTATDTAGNSTNALITVTLDTSLPTVTIIGPTSASTFVTQLATLTLTGSSSDNVSVQTVSWTNAANTTSGGITGGTASWTSTSINLVAGDNVITVTAIDMAGNLSTDVLTVTRDNTVPAIAITSPTSSPSYLTGGASLLISGTASDNVSVASVAWTRLETPPSASGVAAGTNAWSANVPLVVGINTFTFTATDTAGNTATTLIVVTRDTAVPSITILTPTAGATISVNTSPIALAGTAADSDGLANVTWVNAATGGSGTATGGTGVGPVPWNANVPLTNGANALTVTATDSAGNTATDLITVTFDSTKPTVTIDTPTSASSFVTGSSSIILGGSSSDNDGVFSVAWSNAANTTSGAATGTTAWTTPAISLVAGANVITVTVTDNAGNTSTAVITVTLDGTAPGVTITSPTAAPTFVTNLSSLNLGGTATDNVSVASVSWSRAEGGGATGSATGTTVWNANVPLVAGTNTITVTATDTAGGTSTDVLTVTRDTTLPAITITAPTGAPAFATNAAPLLLGGTSSDNTAVASVTWSNSATGGTGSATGTAIWTATIALANGVNPVVVTATDTAGNVNTASISVTFDAVVPTVTITSPTSLPSFITSATTIAIGGTATDNVSVTSVTWANAANLASGTAGGTPAAWTVASIPLVAGDNPITVTATDSAGNTSTDLITVRQDSVAPTIVITTPTLTGTYVTNLSPLNLGGTSNDDVSVASVSWSNPAVPASGGATGTTVWNASIPVAAGVNTITVTVTDTAGNTGTAVITVTQDLTPPAVTITGPTALPTFSTASPSVTLSGTASDAVGLASVTWTNTSSGGSGTATGTTAWSAAVPLTPGSNTVVVTATDTAGNTATASITVINDTQPPTITISTPTSAASFNSPLSPLTVGGSASDNVGVTTVSWTNSATGGSGTATGTTNWSASITLVQGSNQITVTAVDDVGNTSIDTITVSYDPVAPSVNITGPTSTGTYSTKISPLDISGTSSDNLVVTSVTFANTTTGTTGTATGTTAWSASVPLTSGTNVISVTATDGVGNTSSATLTVIFDITAPAVTILTPAPPSVVTQTRPLTITGTATDNVGVTSVSWSNNLNGASGAATFVDPNWTASVSLVPGINLITIRASDALGNIGTATLSVDYSHETVAPGIVIDTPTTLPTFVSAAQLLTVAGTATDNVGVVAVKWQNRNTLVYGTATGTTAWTATVPLNGGVNVLDFSAFDDVGNVTTASLTVTFTPTPETAVPTITITAPTSSDTFDTTVSPLHLECDALDDTGVVAVVWTNQASYGNGISGWGTFWFADIPLVSGVNIITVTAVDPFGNIASDTLTVNFNPPAGDPVPPTIAIMTPLATGTVDVSIPSVNLSGTSFDNVQVEAVTFSNSATGDFGTANGTTAWSTGTLMLNPGVNVITARAIDATGNIGQTTLVVVYTPPAAAKPVAPVIPAGMCGCTGLELLPLLGAVWLRRRLRRRRA